MNPFEPSEARTTNQALFIRVDADWLYLGEATPSSRHLTCYVEDVPEEILPMLRLAYIGEHKVQIMYKGVQKAAFVDIQRDEEGGWDLAFLES